MTTTFSGADLVLADHVVSGHTLVVEDGRIAAIRRDDVAPAEGERAIDVSGHLIIPGLIDVHVHGVNGRDALDGPGAVRAIAADLPRWGVTAFCPTTVACAPDALEAVLAEVAELRAAPPAGAARVLPAHLESNFISPEYHGAQPLACLRQPRRSRSAQASVQVRPTAFTADDVLDVIDRRLASIGIVTLAPELDGGIDLVRALSAAGLRVSLGHTGASFEVARAAIAAGACHATHLFNRMRPMTHRDPGVAGAVLTSDEVFAELICDGHHVHPAMMQIAIAAKRRIVAITDGTAGSGMPAGSRLRLGGQPMTVGDVARLDDGTIAGSVLTMDGALRTLVSRAGLGVADAVRLCSRMPAEAVGLADHGVIAVDAVADFVVLTSALEVEQTWIDGRQVYVRGLTQRRGDAEI